MDFESGIKKLEEIVKSLEKGDLTLDQSVALYAEGLKISAECRKELDNAKLKITEETSD
jgi:exodeoxyribonuclease VII small subunit